VPPDVAYRLSKRTGVWVGRSDDGGASWGPFARAFATDDSDAITGDLAVLPSGRLVIAAFDGASMVHAKPSALRVAISDDRGLTFRHVDVYAPEGSPGDFFPRLAPAGGERLALAWKSGGAEILVALSEDAGETWGTPRAWSAPGDEAAAGAWALAHGDRLDVAWFVRSGEAEARLHVASMDLATDATPASFVVAQNITGLSFRPANTEFAHFVHAPDGRTLIVWSDRASGTTRLAVESG
jgi:hypothetical protein